MELASEKLTRLELKVLAVALSECEGAGVRQFFNIIPLLRVEQRKYTGFGFFSKFVKNERLKRSEVDATPPSNNPPGAVGFHPDMEGYVDFLVWIKDGEIDCLEAASTGHWPEDEAKFVVSRWPK